MTVVADYGKPYLNLKSIIVSKGMKQNDVAQKLNMSKTTF